MQSVGHESMSSNNLDKTMKNSILSVALFASVCVAMVGSFVSAEDAKKSETPSTQPAAINTLCPIGKEEIDPEVTYVHEGKTIGFCCEPCIGKFKKDPAKYMKDLK
jgi:YHS domain-containing protein